MEEAEVAWTVPGYEVGETIGRGGWGVVVRARHIAIGRDVAIKRLPPSMASDPVNAQRFADEARAIGSLDHPHIVKIHDFIEHDGQCFIVMEYLAGGTLWDRFQASGIRTDQACAIGMGVSLRFAAAHRRGILHRDVKPENLLFTDDDLPRLGDFGIAKLETTVDRRTKVGDVVGTPTYMSPEQAMGEPTAAQSDIYSLGMVLYELLAGRMPYPEAATPMQQLLQHINVAPAPLESLAPQVPKAVADVIMQALEKDPADRPQAAEDFGVLLAGAACASFGSQWLAECSIPVMASGAIQDAATRGTPIGGGRAAPTLTMPVPRADHFRDDEAEDFIDTGEFEASPIDRPRPSDPQPTLVAAPPKRPTEPTSLPPYTRSAEAAGEPQSRPGPSRRVLAGAAAAVILFAGVAFVVAGRDGDGSLPAVAGPGSSTTEAASATTGSTGTTARLAMMGGGPIRRKCDREDPGAVCAYLTSLTHDNQSFIVDWEPVGFTPSFETEGSLHVNFFWNTIPPGGAGAQAFELGVRDGQYESTIERPFVGGAEGGSTLFRVEFKPLEATEICAVVADLNQIVIDPSQYDCLPLSLEDFPLVGDPAVMRNCVVPGEPNPENRETCPWAVEDSSVP